MATRFYNVEKAAEVLGVSPAEVNRLREENRLHGYRDGATWKFKSEDVDKLAAELKGEAEAAPAAAEDDGDVLLSEVELGGSEAGSSGTVIGEGGKGSPADSDISLGKGGAADSDINLASDSGLELAGSGAGKAGELDLTLDEDITLDDSQIAGSKEKELTPKASAPGDSSVDLGAKPADSDDEMVLEGGPSGSDITLGGDSGISLVDPADSGLSLEEPLELAGGSDKESLELGEDDMLTLEEQVDTEAPTELKADDEFLLTPLEEGSEEEEAESGSQVIALEGEMAAADAATMVAGGGAGLPAMLDEDLGGLGLGGGPGTPFGGDAGPALGAPTPGMGYAAEPGAVAAMALPETPYSGWVFTGLILCAVLLMLIGWMMVDLMRNMWGWQGTYPANSWIMDQILSLFGG